MVATYEIGRALDLIRRVEDEMDGRWKRMDADYKLARSDSYDTNIDAQGDAEGTDFKSFTSTVASAFVKKVVATLSGAKVSIQVKYGAAQTQQRQLYDMKERFAEGILAQADDELIRIIQLPVHDQISWFSPNRGWIVGRGIFVNHDDGTTTPSIRPWDPINTTWQVGARGLMWAAHKTRRKLDELSDEWPAAKTIAGQPDDEIDVYDMWTETHNAVFTSDKVFLKRWTRHGAPRCPVVIVPVPTQPKIWSEGVTDSEDNYGESVLATNRSLYNYVSEVMSISLDLLEKARRPSAIAFTEDEDAELAEDPNEGEGVQYLGANDRFQQLVPPETTHDAIQFMTMTMAMLQRGDLPFSTYGDIQFALSGYAITQLNQQMLTVIGPQTRAMGRFKKEMLDLMVDQYVSGAFNPITVRGSGNNKDYMEMEIPPDALRNLPPYKVMIVAELPQDDVAKLQAAQTARQGPTPFLPDRWLLDEYLKVPDTSLIERQLKEQSAERMHPRAITLVMAIAARESGRPDLAQVYVDEMINQQIQLQIQRQMMMGGIGGPGGPGGIGPGGGPGGGGTPSAAPGIPGGVMPDIALQGGQLAAPQAPTGAEGRFGLPRRNI